jgi:hypothetical protein
MKKFLIDMFSSKEGVSHKRVLGALGFIALITYMFIYHDNVSVEAVEYVTIAYGLGTVAEKLIKKPLTPPTIEVEEPKEE